MKRWIWNALAIACIPVALAVQAGRAIPNVLPETATASLTASLDAAKPHARHVWRDTPPVDAAGFVNAYVEIARGDRRKWEFAMRANARAIDRVMPPEIGGYPVNYGFVPQTISYDGDPFDVLVLGPAIEGGLLVRGPIVGLMLMEDEKGLDSKVVISPAGPDGRPRYKLDDAEQERIADYFRRYKLHEPGKFSKVPGWGSAAEGRAFVDMTHAFFDKCRTVSRGDRCSIAEKK
jgi:inorganic pyrophosphatase